MIGGAVLNAAAFTGGNYLAKYIAGDGGQAALAEKTRHDKALEAYQSAMENIRASARRFLTGLNQQRNQSSGESKLHEHRLRVQALQPGPPRLQINSAHKAEILGHVSAKWGAETGRASFCHRGRTCVWLRGFSFSLNIFSPYINGR